MSREASESSRAIRASERAGTITDLAVQPSQPTRVAVFLDGVLACEVSQETLSAEEQTHLAAAEQLMAAQAVAMQYLAARPRTAHEVQQKLHRHGVADSIIEQVMARLHACGALDDAAYVHAYLTSRLTSRGYGPQRLRRELHQRGVSRALVTEAVQQDLAAEDVLAAARVQATKRWPRLAREAHHGTRRQKLHDFLRRRGFPAAIVQQVLTEVVQGTAADEEA
jgi:regulatory protein